MKFTCSVNINKPKKIVAKIFADPNLLGEYQDGFLKKEIVSGKPGEVGTISKMYYKVGKGEMILKETVLKNNLPDLFFAEYYHKHTENTMQSNFIEITENSTTYNAEIHYTAFKGVVVNMMKINYFMYMHWIKIKYN